MMKLLAICLAAVFFTATVSADGTVCENKSLSSNNFRYSKTVLPRTILSVYPLDRQSNTHCTLDATYGFVGNTLWVNRGCRSNFRVCYNSVYAGSTRTVTVSCSSNNYAQRSCSAGGTVVDISVQNQLSNTACIAGASYFGMGNNVVVLHGCRANFKVIRKA